MLNRFFGNNFHTHLHIFGLCCVAAGVPFNKIMMSLAMMLIVVNLFIEGEFKLYFQHLKSNKIYLLVLGFFLLHVIALLWTSNFDFALHDLKVKLPFLVIPTIIAAKPITKTNYINLILASILLSTVTLSLINFFSYHTFFSGETQFNFREMSLFTSHIRFGIIISMVVGIALHFIRKSTGNKLAFVLVIIWLTFYTIYSQVISGWISLLLVFSIYGIYVLRRKYKWILLTSFGLFSVLFIFLLSWLFSPVIINKDNYVDIEKYTAEGNQYSHVFGVVDPETEKPIHLYVCSKELKREWPKRSNFPIDSLDNKGQSIYETLIRFLASKNVKKDAVGLSRLSHDEIIGIENGVTSALMNGVMERLYGIKYQLINKSNPNNHSLLQRLEYWKTALEIANKNILIGVGTGDVQDAFNSQYERNESLLNLDKRRRAHNYYLTVQITFGIVGLLYFLLLLFNFVRFNYRENQMIGVIFILIIIVSFFLEDTIETQTGVTFFGLFYGLFSFKHPSNNDIKLEL